MKASIDIKITYDDLSDQCKQKIKKLEKELDCTINLVYPDITSTPNISFGKTHDWSTTTPPHIIHDWTDNWTDDWKANTIDCNSATSSSVHS